jgi:putative lipoic acid-binding regulatory protein
MPIEPEVYDFPTSIPLKVIGRNTDDFEEFVLGLFAKHVEREDIHAVTQRPSRGEHYISLTVTFTAHSREGLDALYSELTSQRRILMVI